jgi:hypothetical protein
MHTTETAPDPVILAHLAYVEARTACCEMCGRERPLAELDAVSTDFVTCSREVGGCDGVSL